MISADLLSFFRRNEVEPKLVSRFLDAAEKQTQNFY